VKSLCTYIREHSADFKAATHQEPGSPKMELKK
jgi:hypothetical protein